MLKTIIGSSTALSAVFCFTSKALAAYTGGQNYQEGSATNFELGYWVKFIFNWVSVIAGLIFVVMFLVGGIQYLTAAGNEEQSSKAKKLLVDAVVGLIIVLIAYAAGKWVLQSVGLDDVPGID